MKGISWKAISPINIIFPSKTKTYFFELSNKVNNAINNNDRSLIKVNCIMLHVHLLFAKLGRNSNTVQSELSPIVQWMEFGLSPEVTF
jgi:hypothetical protein